MRSISIASPLAFLCFLRSSVLAVEVLAVVVVVVLVVVIGVVCRLFVGAVLPSCSMLASSWLAVLLSSTDKLWKIGASRPQMLHVPVGSARQCSHVSEVSSGARVFGAVHVWHVAAPSNILHA